MMKRTILLSLAALCCALTAAAQDLIVKTDAAKIEAKVIEITPEAVRYKRFSNPDGPTYVLPVVKFFENFYRKNSLSISILNLN